MVVGQGDESADEDEGIPTWPGSGLSYEWGMGDERDGWIGVRLVRCLDVLDALSKSLVRDQVKSNSQQMRARWSKRATVHFLAFGLRNSRTVI
jgi:hypothetical protein